MEVSAVTTSVLTSECNRRGVGTHNTYVKRRRFQWDVLAFFKYPECFLLREMDGISVVEEYNHRTNDLKDLGLNKWKD